MKRERWLFRLVAVVGILGLASVTHAAPVDPAVTQAKAHYQAGSRAYALGDFVKAVEEYKAAYNIKPDPVFLYNIAQSYRLADDKKQALFFYRSYLNNSPQAPNRTEIEDRIAKLEVAIAAEKAVVVPKPVEPAPIPVVTPVQPPPTIDVVSTTRPQTQERTPVYKKWWLWTTVGVVVVGAGLGIGLGLGLQPHGPSSKLGTTGVF